MRLARLLTLLLAMLPGEAVAEPGLDALIAAYPDLLSSYTDTELVWKDGTRMPLAGAGPNSPLAERLDRAGIRDQFAIRYPLAAEAFRPPAVDEDPGRIRSEALFLKMYGDCRRGEVAPKLRAVSWLP